MTAHFFELVGIFIKVGDSAADDEGLNQEEEEEEDDDKWHSKGSGVYN